MEQRQTRSGAKQWRKIAEFYPSPGFLAEKMTIFLATHLVSGQSTPMEDERIEARWFSARELAEWIAAGKIKDAKTIIGFSRYKK